MAREAQRITEPPPPPPPEEPVVDSNSGNDLAQLQQDSTRIAKALNEAEKAADLIRGREPLPTAEGA